MYFLVLLSKTSSLLGNTAFKCLFGYLSLYSWFVANVNSVLIFKGKFAELVLQFYGLCLFAHLTDSQGVKSVNYLVTNSAITKLILTLNYLVLSTELTDLCKMSNRGSLDDYYQPRGTL
jgi:hypothetical protein